MASAPARAGIPRALPVESFASTREPELRALLRAGVPDGDPTLPRHLRRRAGSHWRRRIKRRPNATFSVAADGADASSGALSERPTNRRMRRARGHLAVTVLGASLWLEEDFADVGEAEEGTKGAEGDEARLPSAEATREKALEGVSPEPSPAMGRTRRIPSHLWHAKRFAMGCPFPGLPWRLPIAAFAARARKVRARGTKSKGTKPAEKKREREGTDVREEEDDEEESDGDGASSELGEQEMEDAPSSEGEQARGEGDSGNEANGFLSASTPARSNEATFDLACALPRSSTPRFPRCTVHDGGYFCSIALDLPARERDETGDPNEPAEPAEHAKRSLEGESLLVRRLLGLHKALAAGRVSSLAPQSADVRFSSRCLAPGIVATVQIGEALGDLGSSPSVRCILHAHAAVAAALWHTVSSSRALSGASPRLLPLGLLQLRGPDATAALRWLKGPSALENVPGASLPRVASGASTPRAADGQNTWVRLCDPRLDGLPEPLRGTGARADTSTDGFSGVPTEASSPIFSPPPSLDALARGPAPHSEALVSALRQRCRLQALGVPETSAEAAALDALVASSAARRAPTSDATLSQSGSAFDDPDPTCTAPWTWALATRVAPPCPLSPTVAALPPLEGWDLTLPLRWVAPLLASLASRGAEVAGQERWKDVHAISGIAWFDGATEVDATRRALATPDAALVEKGPDHNCAQAASAEAAGPNPESAKQSSSVPCCALLRPARRGDPRAGATVSFPSSEGAALWARPRDAPEIRWSGGGRKKRRTKGRKGAGDAESAPGEGAPASLSPRLAEPCGSVTMACPAGCAFKAKWARALVHVPADLVPTLETPLEERLAFFRNPNSHVAFPCRLVLLRDELAE